MGRFADDQGSWEGEPPSRAGRLTLGLDKAQDRILEIGPSIAPLVSKRDGWRVRTVDHASKEELIDKYSDQENLDTTAIEEVDFVWRQGPLDQCIPDSFHGTFDACLLSHVLEHVPDPAGFFRSIARVLKEDGTLSMAVPDKRYCFDYFRPHSTTGAVLTASFARTDLHDPGTLFDYFAYSCSNHGLIAWDQSPPHGLELNHGQLGVGGLNLELFEHPPDRYIDCHAWQFTPASFSLLVLELSALGQIDFRVRHMYAPKRCEFIVHLQKGAKPHEAPESFQSARLALLEEIVLENGEQADLLRLGRSPLGRARRVAVKWKDRISRRLKQA